MGKKIEEFSNHVYNACDEHCNSFNNTEYTKEFDLTLTFKNTTLIMPIHPAQTWRDIQCLIGCCTIAAEVDKQEVEQNIVLAYNDQKKFLKLIRPYTKSEEQILLTLEVNKQKITVSVGPWVIINFITNIEE